MGPCERAEYGTGLAQAHREDPGDEAGKGQSLALQSSGALPFAPSPHGCFTVSRTLEWLSVHGIERAQHTVNSKCHLGCDRHGLYS